MAETKDSALHPKASKAAKESIAVTDNKKQAEGMQPVDYRDAVK